LTFLRAVASLSLALNAAVGCASGLQVGSRLCAFSLFSPFLAFYLICFLDAPFRSGFAKKSQKLAKIASKNLIFRGGSGIVKYASPSNAFNASVPGFDRVR